MILNRRKRVLRTQVPAPTPPLDPFGLIFPSNGVGGSDIRILWSDSNLLPRTAHTAIWKAYYVQQTGYYAVSWHSYNDGTWHAGNYEFGCHPFPCNGAVDGNGQATGGTAGSGTVHYHELAGLGAHDYLNSPGAGDGLLVTKGQWYTQARTCEVVGGTTLRHTYYPDVEGNPSFAIVQDITLASLPSPSGPAFYFGASDWTASGSANSETPSCTLRGLMLFDAALSLSDITTEAANESSNAAVTSAGIAAVWYCNKNPTPSDVSDKQSQRTQHSPAWANANRPTLYTG